MTGSNPRKMKPKKMWLGWIDQHGHVDVIQIPRRARAYRKLLEIAEITHSSDAFAVFLGWNKEDALTKARARVGAETLQWQEAKVWSRGQWAPIDIN